MSHDPSNDEIADVLDRIAALLEAQSANPFRIGAYRDGAASVRAADRPLAEMVRRGEERELEKLPRIGEGLARLIAEYVNTGRSGLLGSLEAEVSPADALARVPGMDEALAERVVSALGIRTPEELELAAHDGRLEEMEGFDAERLRAVQLGLAGMLSPAARRRSRQRVERRSPDTGAGEERPGVETLLAIDAEYRAAAEAGRLRTIAPRRFNPEGEAWLPVFEADGEGWHFTALFSNTARAHQLGKVRDWVVIYWERQGHQHQATVVTATDGPLQGKRVVRGREKESRAYYET